MHTYVLDAGSDDHTVQFARGAGASVEQRDWTDFFDARTYALSRVATPWVLMIDADEALDDVLRDAIVSASPEKDAYRVKRTTYFCGKPMRIWRNEPLIRLFQKGRARLEAHPAASESAPVHEGWSSEGSVADLPGTMLHYSYPDVATYRAKYDRYTTLEAASMERSFVRWLTACGTSVVRMIWLLVGRGALLDGPRGWYVAYRSATYPAIAARKALFG